LVLLLPLLLDVPDTVLIKDAAGTEKVPLKIEALEGLTGGGTGEDSLNLDEILGDNEFRGLTLQLTNVKNKIAGTLYLALGNGKNANGEDVYEFLQITDGVDAAVTLPNVTGIPTIKLALDKSPGGGAQFYLKADMASAPGGEADLLTFNATITAGLDVNQKIF
jgi:hypothetical protein